MLGISDGTDSYPGSHCPGAEGYLPIRIRGDTQGGLCPGARGWQVHNLDEEISLDRYKIHTIEAIVDRLVYRKIRYRRGDSHSVQG